MGLLSNRYDVEDALNNAMTTTAMEWGKLDTEGYAPLMASTYGQGEMFGQSIGAMLGGKQPLMRKQDLIDELMSKHQDPRTKEDLLNVAKDAAGLGLYDVQQKFLEIAAEIPDQKKATKEDINVLLGNLRLTQGSDMMIDQYLIQKVDAKVWGDATPTDKEGYRKEVRAKFEDIINGYGLFLGTQGLAPEDVNDMMFTNDGQVKNITMFQQYLRSLSGSNVFAKYLLDNNDVLMAALEVDKKNGNSNGNGAKKKVVISDESTHTKSSAESKGIDLGALSKNDKIKVNNEANLNLITELNRVWSSMAQIGGGILGEANMTAADLTEENQDDEIQDWIGGMGFYSAGGEAYKHFSSQPIEKFKEFLQDPEAYYRKYILKKKHYTEEGVLKEETEEAVVTLWGLE